MIDSVSIEYERRYAEGCLGALFAPKGLAGKFVAKAMTESGLTVLDETPEIRSLLDSIDSVGLPEDVLRYPQSYRFGYNPVLNNEYSKLTARLQNKGYVPAATNPNGWIILMTRTSSDARQSPQASVSAKLINQLRELYEAGVISKPEFEEKKRRQHSLGQMKRVDQAWHVDSIECRYS